MWGRTETIASSCGQSRKKEGANHIAVLIARLSLWKRRGRREYGKRKESDGVGVGGLFGVK